ncbi:hypothetical protein QTP86_020092, partial [Hemibagrus guttatus]
ISNNRISITHSQEGDNSIVTCVLAGNDSLTQVNWEMVQGSNHTKLGIFHPNKGTYIFPEHSSKVFSHLQLNPMVQDERKGLIGQFGALTVGCILSLLFLIITIYTCWWCFCRRYFNLPMMYICKCLRYSMRIETNQQFQRCTQKRHVKYNIPPLPLALTLQNYMQRLKRIYIMADYGSPTKEKHE